MILPIRTAMKGWRVWVTHGCVLPPNRLPSRRSTRWRNKSAQMPTLVARESHAPPQGGASHVWTTPMESAVAYLRRSVVGFRRRSDGGGILWVGNGWRFCALLLPPFSSGDYGWLKGNRSGEEKRLREEAETARVREWG